MESRNTRAMKSLAIGLAALTYVGAVIYGDIMFLQVMGKAFPSGIIGALAMAGAVMTAVSAITLPLALHFWFKPGLQFIWGVIFWLLDVAVLGLNSILAFAIASGVVTDSWLLIWGELSPATPLVAVFGWGLAFLFDPSQKLMHAKAEHEADLIDIYAEQMKQAAKEANTYEIIQRGAHQQAAQYAGYLTGTRIPVDKLPPHQLPAIPAEIPPTTEQPKKYSVPFLLRSKANGVTPHSPGGKSEANPTTRQEE